MAPVIPLAGFSEASRTAPDADRRTPSIRSRTTLGIAFLIVSIAFLDGCTAWRIVRHNYAGIGDYRIFAAREVRRSSEPFRFREPPPAMRDSARAILTDHFRVEGKGFEDWLRDRGAVALLVLHGDTLLCETYFDGYADSSIVPSFSVAKSFISALVGVAIFEGHIQNVEEPVTDYIPELAGRGFERVTIRHLLQMTSGIKFKESYKNPFGGAAVFYYTSNLEKHLMGLTLEHEPGTVFSYRSVDPQVLGLILERATGMPPAKYLETRLWQPLGMEYDASWSLDRRDGMEKAFCCLNARARDYARFGLLYLNRGAWQGRRIFPESWVAASTTPAAVSGGEDYGYLWWLGSTEDGDFYAHGLRGECIYVHPPTRTVIVALSKKEWGVDPTLLARLSRALRSNDAESHGPLR